MCIFVQRECVLRDVFKNTSLIHICNTDQNEMDHLSWAKRGENILEKTYRLLVWKQEWSPTRKGWFEAISKTCFSVCTQSMSSSSLTSSFFITFIAYIRSVSFNRTWSYQWNFKIYVQRNDLPSWPLSIVAMNLVNLANSWVRINLSFGCQGTPQSMLIYETLYTES